MGGYCLVLLYGSANVHVSHQYDKYILTNKHFVDVIDKALLRGHKGQVEELWFSLDSIYRAKLLHAKWVTLQLAFVILWYANTRGR